MSKLQEIKTAQLQARKERNTVKANLLTTLIGEAEMVGKSAGNRESTDAEVLQVVKKFEKNMLENIDLFTKRNLIEQVINTKLELDILREFLPTKLTDVQVQSDIKTIVAEMNIPMERKSMGTITKTLKEKYGEQFDGSQVSRIFSAML